MKNNQHNIPHFLTVVAMLLMTSVWMSGCFVAKPYQSPQNVINDQFYRSDQLSGDTLNMANVSWKDLFTDPKLQGYINEALQNNLDIKNAIQQIQIAEAYLKQSRAAFYPSLFVEPSYSGQSNSLNSALGQLGGGTRQYINQYGLAASLSWEADLWGKIKSSKGAALANLLSTRSAHQAVKSNLVAAIADTYYQLVALDEQKRITEQTIVFREQNLSTTKSLKEAGTVTAVAVKQSEALLLNSRGLLVSLDNNIKLLENYFCMLLSIPPGPIDRNTLDQQEITTPLAAGVPIQLLTNRPDVREAEFNYMNAFYNTNVARAAFYPSLTLTASGGLQSVNFDKLFNATSLFGTVAGSLLQPVINKRQIRSQYEIAKSTQEIAYNNYKSTILSAARDVSDALYSYDAQSKLIDLKFQEFQQYDTAVQYSQQLVNNGMGNYLDVITAMQNSLNAELSYVDAKYGKLSDIVQLYKALGGGWK